MSETLKVGLLGCGQIAQSFHLKVLARSPQVELVALADADESLLSRAKQRAPRARTFTDYRQLLADSDAEAEVICLPTGLHGPSAVAAFEAGKHVYLEKPLAISLDQADAVMAAWRRSERVGMIGFNYRYHPLHREAKRLIDAGRIGRVVGVRSVFCSAVRPLPAWKQSRAKGGGVLLDLASHHIDLAHFFLDREIQRVSATLESIRSEQDTAGLTLELAAGEQGGQRIIMQSFHCLAACDVDRFEFVGDNGRMTLDRYNGQLEVQPAQSRQGRNHHLRQGLGMVAEACRSLARTLRPPGEPSFGLALNAFVTAALRGDAVRPDLERGYQSLRVVHAAETSARAGEAVSCQPSARKGTGP